MSSFKEKITTAVKVSVLALVLIWGTGFVLAQSWVPPEGSPPGSNVHPALNVSEVGQTKSGALWSDVLFGAPEICINGDCRGEWPGSSPSDSSLKNNLSSISDEVSAVRKVLGLNGVFFDWNDLYKTRFGGVDKDKRQVGLIAQEVEKYLPEAVSSTSRDGNEYKTVDYAKITPLLIEAIKEQQIMIEDQQRQINELRSVIK